MTKSQVKAVNRLKVDHDRLADLLKNLRSQSVIKDTIITNRAGVITELTSEKAIYTKIISNNQLIQKSLQKDLDAANKEVRKLKTANTILEISTGALGVTVLVLKFLH